MHVSTPPNQPWARLHVVRGADPQSLRFHADQPLELSVGSAPLARLCLRLASVAPRQFEVFWDGAALWFQDPLRLGRTFVNGQLLNEWVLIRGQALVAFGSVRLWAAAASPYPAPALPDFGSFERLRGEPSARFASRRLPTMRFTLTPTLEAREQDLEAQLSEAVGS